MLRHFIANLIAMLMPTRALRDKVRAKIRYPQVRGYVKWVRDYARSHNMKKSKMKIRVGFGSKNYVIILNKKYVFKFPLWVDSVAASGREKRIVDVFQKISPIKTPGVELIKFGDIIVRKYDFVHGLTLVDLKAADVLRHREKIAKQIANFLYVVGRADPKELRDLKPKPDAKPGFLYGWFHGDIWQNFMLDPKTFDVVYFIDWEEAGFKDFRPSLRDTAHHWERYKYVGLIVDCMAEYAKLYYGDK